MLNFEQIAQIKLRKMTYEKIQSHYNVTRQEAEAAFLHLLPKIAKIKSEKLNDLKRQCYQDAIAATGANSDKDIKAMARDHVDGELPRLDIEAEEASRAGIEQLYNKYFKHI